MRRFGAAAKYLEDLAAWTELCRHARAVVDEPDVVLRVDPDRVSPGFKVEVTADFTDERTVGRKLVERCGTRTDERGFRSGAAINEDVAVRVDCYPSRLTEIEIGRETQWCDGVIFQLRCRLAVSGGAEEKRNRREHGRPAYVHHIVPVRAVSIRDTHDGLTLRAAGNSPYAIGAVSTVSAARSAPGRNLSRLSYACLLART